MGKWSGVAVAAVLLVTGCAHSKKAPIDNSEKPFQIGREDVIEVAVWRDADLSRVIPVRPDGFISMPIIGDVQAAGRTPNELASELKEKLKPYVQDPKITVIVREVHSSRVFVTGEVANPGAYPLRGRVSVLQAVALAGGFTDFANSDGIVVIRNGETGSQIPVRYSDLIGEDGREAEVILRPGDTVVVP
jgi:polysaccharide export outer membrane protein